MVALIFCWAKLIFGKNHNQIIELEMKQYISVVNLLPQVWLGSVGSGLPCEKFSLVGNCDFLDDLLCFQLMLPIMQH